jgi:hypothetical protein
MQVWRPRAEFEQAQIWLRDIVRGALAQGEGDHAKQKLKQF